MKKKGYFSVFLWAIIFLVSTHVHATGKRTEVKLPENISSELIHLLQTVEPGQRRTFTPQITSNILAFMERKKNTNTLYHAGSDGESPSAYHEFDVQRNLEYILKYTFNPDIPCSVMIPNSARLSYWKEVEGYGRKLPRLTDYLSDLNTPIIIKGVEFIENTPDIFSGAYYSYHLYRTLILFKYQGRNVLISISKQTDVSNVGKKGYVLGSDDNWDYFYSGEPGTNISGLGWVRSYMYDSYGVTIYYELDNQAPRVRCGSFRWIRAGWSQINFVKNRHIYKGLMRFAESFKEIMAYPEMPDADELAKTFMRMVLLPEEELKKKTEIYIKILKNRYDTFGSTSKNFPSKLFRNSDHWFNMSKEEMVAALGVEYIKYVMGKTHNKKIRELFHFVN